MREAREVERAQNEQLRVLSVRLVQVGTRDPFSPYVAPRFPHMSEINSLRGPSLVLKPALGSRGDGVELLCLHGADDSPDSPPGRDETPCRPATRPVPPSCARTVSRAVARGDCLLQPFLSGVRRRGELAIVFVNGELLHVVRK